VIPQGIEVGKAAQDQGVAAVELQCGISALDAASPA